LLDSELEKLYQENPDLLQFTKFKKAREKRNSYYYKIREDGRTPTEKEKKAEEQLVKELKIQTEKWLKIRDGQN
jgi:hypothetical protein